MFLLLLRPIDNDVLMAGWIAMCMCGGLHRLMNRLFECGDDNKFCEHQWTFLSSLRSPLTVFVVEIISIMPLT